MHVRVESSQIFSLDYEPGDEVLRVRFKCQHCKAAENCEACHKCRGRGYSSEYKYHAVPAEKYAAVRDGKRGPDDPISIGASFNHHIKRGGYQFTRL